MPFWQLVEPKGANAWLYKAVQYDFGKQYRLLKTDDFSSVFAFKEKVYHFGAVRVLRAKNNLGYARMGLIVGKKAAKQAHRRNYMKRRLREWFRLNRHRLPEKDWVIHVTHAFDKQTFIHLDTQLLKLLRKEVNDKTEPSHEDRPWKQCSLPSCAFINMASALFLRLIVAIRQRVRNMHWKHCKRTAHWKAVGWHFAALVVATHLAAVAMTLYPSHINTRNINMEQKSSNNNLIIFMALALMILMGWSYFFPPPEPPKEAAVPASTSTTASLPPNADAALSGSLKKSVPVSVKTDVFNLEIDSQSGDIRHLELNHYNASDNAKEPFVLFEHSDKSTYIAQSDLLDSQSHYLLADAVFSDGGKNHYEMQGDTLRVPLRTSLANGLTVEKIFTFKKGSYEIGIDYAIRNDGTQSQQLAAMYRLLRDDQKPAGENTFAYTYTGPVLYTPEGKFQKVSFSDLEDKDADYIQHAQTGWLGMIQHYFMATWILQPKGQASICGEAKNCQIDFSQRSKDGLFSAGVLTPLPTIAPGQQIEVPMTLYAGPQTYRTISQVADNLQLVKDYGKVHIFASPLFWLLDKLHTYVGNWGWAIILLVIIVKAVLYPLTAASYRSMAKMRAVAPRLQALKDQFGDDRMKMQQEMMNMYKKEKINPLGGCLPMLIQIPVFIGLYWALLSSVELRQAPWIGWITDLARKDPYYILPLIMAATMFVQTRLNPAPTDPMQAKMMKIMPIAFSVLFFFFPAGLVLYYVVNNILSVAQQWYINKDIERRAAKHRHL